MKYPIDVEKYVQTTIEALDTYDTEDLVLISVIAQDINKAYYAGLEEGRKEK